MFMEAIPIGINNTTSTVLGRSVLVYSHFTTNNSLPLYIDVLPGDSRDKLGRSRFHCLTPKGHVHGNYPKWYLHYDKYGAKKVS